MYFLWSDTCSDCEEPTTSRERHFWGMTWIAIAILGGIGAGVWLGWK